MSMEDEFEAEDLEHSLFGIDHFFYREFVVTSINHYFLDVDCAHIFNLWGQENCNHAVKVNIIFIQASLVDEFFVEIIIKNLDSDEKRSVVRMTEDSEDLDHPVEQALSMLLCNVMVENLLIYGCHW